MSSDVDDDPVTFDEDRSRRMIRAVAVRAALAVLVALVAVGVSALGVVRRAEERVLDRRIVLWRQLSEANTSRVTLVAIDEESLAELNAQWPLPRGTYARAIDRLRKAGASAIGVTVVFEGKSGEPLQDQALAAVVDGKDDVVLASRVDGATVVTPPFHCPTGFCEVPLDTDGVARQFYLSPAGIDPPPVCLALGLLRASYKNLEFVPRGFVGDPGTLYPIAWAGMPGRTFNTIPLKKVLAGGDISSSVKGSIVILGSTLPGTANSIRTPFAKGARSAPPDPPMTSVELTANLVFTLLGSDALEPLTRPQYLLLVAGLAFVCFMMFGSLHPLMSLVVAIFVGVLYGVGASYAMILSQRLLPLVVPLVAVGLAWVSSIAYRAGRVVAARHRAA